jgi:hypothetical protein
MVQLPIAEATAGGGQERSTIFVLAEKSEQVQLDQLKQFFADRGAAVTPTGSADAFNTLLSMLSLPTAKFLSICQGERETEMVLNSFFSLIGIFPIGEAKQLVQTFGQLVSGPEFKGQGWASYSGVAVKVLSSLFNFYNSHPEVRWRVNGVDKEVFKIWRF